jgi:hypothetical protein
MLGDQSRDLKRKREKASSTKKTRLVARFTLGILGIHTFPGVSKDFLGVGPLRATNDICFSSILHSRPSRPSTHHLSTYCSSKPLYSLFLLYNHAPPSPHLPQHNSYLYFLSEKRVLSKFIITPASQILILK